MNSLKTGNPHSRTVHNVNVTASYNVMRTAADQGIRRIVQASSVNATGLLYSHDSRRKFEELPLTEQSPAHPEDPYSTSKAMLEYCKILIYPTVRFIEAVSIF